jgi:hypothetical protein
MLYPLSYGGDTVDASNGRGASRYSLRSGPMDTRSRQRSLSIAQATDGSAPRMQGPTQLGPTWAQVVQSIVCGRWPRTQIASMRNILPVPRDRRSAKATGESFQVGQDVQPEPDWVPSNAALRTMPKRSSVMQRVDT